MDAPLESEDETLFSFARRVGRGLATGVAAGHPRRYHVAHPLFDAEPPPACAAHLRRHGGRAADLNLSSAGVYPFRTAFAGFRLRAAHIVGWWCPAAGTHVLLAATVAGRLCCSWVHERSPANARAARRLARGVRALVERAAAPGPGPALGCYFAEAELEEDLEEKAAGGGEGTAAPRWPCAGSRAGSGAS